ncbi:probable sterigmatocystin biosynthesis P450 monooxygenase STCB [Aspergillus udagawae]|nr:probable sterigmatocystin biosynthesis P450 monooxygenase STCB [Aspergillus udagawae]
MSDTSLRVVEPLVDSRIQFTIQRMKGDMERAGVVNVHKWWILMTSDIIGELSFGESLGLLEIGKESQFITDLKAIGMMEGLNTTFPSLVKLASIFPLPFIPNVVSGGHRMVQYANEAITRYKKQLVTNAENPKVSLFTRLYNETADGLTDAEIRDEALSYIIAGSDTTATTLTYLVWAVCRNPNIKTALLEEVNSLPADFNDQDTRQLSYLGQVINETLRLYAAAPSALPRVVPSGGRMLAGHFVPEGITVSTQAYSLHRDPTIFPEPNRQVHVPLQTVLLLVRPRLTLFRFNPSRWKNATKMMKDAFMPFGGGSRICIGLHLALREIRLATCYFFRTFPHAEVSDENSTDTDMDQVIYFLMAPKGKRCLIRCLGPS